MVPTSLLIAPTPSEYAAVRVAVSDRLVGGSLRVVQCGMGPERVTALCRQLECSGWTGSLALVGWAGGLCPDLVAGDLVLAGAAVDAHGHRVPLAPASLPGARVGAMLCVSAPLLTLQAKRAVQGSGALAVEMEAYPLASWAAARGLPFVHARVILDTAHESLPHLGDALDPSGRVRPLRLARRLLTRPRMALSLLQLAHRARELDPRLKELARAVAALLPE
jgi:nucleoside phosphorylase